MRLNGWQRLWIVLTLIWTIAVGVQTWNTWPETYLVVDPNAGIPLGADVTYLVNGIIKKNETLTRVQPLD